MSSPDIIRVASANSGNRDTAYPSHFASVTAAFRHAAQAAQAAQAAKSVSSHAEGK